VLIRVTVGASAAGEAGQMHALVRYRGIQSTILLAIAIFSLNQQHLFGLYKLPSLQPVDIET
jgi:hypothetical protein